MAGNVWEAWHNAPKCAHDIQRLSVWWQKEKRRRAVAGEWRRAARNGERVRVEAGMRAPRGV